MRGRERETMALLDGFDLDADISVSELRQEDVLGERLGAHRRLRLRRRNDILGVVVSADEWRAHTDYVRDLEARVERHEDDAVRALISERAPHAQFVPATPEVIDDIERRYEALAKGE
jgi:hypothetical protein